jgi:1-acyl-sn-glycerol-3-phosphate acyltransferase
MLPKHADQLWRVAMTGLAFAGLGLGGIVLALAIIPLVTSLQRDPAARETRAQTIIQASFQLYVFLLRFLRVIAVNVEGAERIAACRGNLIVANHPTLLDVVLLVSLLPKAQCVVKHQLWRNLFLGPIVRTAGYIRNDLEPEAFIERCRATLTAGNNLIIFPEGTRSTPGEPLHFQRSFAHVATLTGFDLQPIVITCDPITLVKGQPWYAVPARLPHFRIAAANLVEMRPFLDTGPRAKSARRLVAHLETYYHGQLAHAGA